jgi:hypothetical protein
VRCTVHLTKFAAQHVTEVLLVRHSTLYARGHSKRGSTAIRLTNKRRLRAGRYTLILVKTFTHKRMRAMRSAVRIG